MIINKDRSLYTESNRERAFLGRLQTDPAFFCKEILGVKHVWGKMKDILESVEKNPRTVVKAGYGVSKSYTAACIAIWYLNVFKDSVVITTAPTHLQVQDILWAEIRQLYNNAKVPLGGKVLLTEIRKADKWYAMGISPKLDTKTAGVRFQGFHAPHVLVIFDEAPGISSDLYDSAEGLMSGEHARWLCIGNPISDNDKFAGLFKTKGWNGFTISCLESPNVVSDSNLIPGMVTKAWVDDKLEQWGEESSLYRTKVLGEFPHESSDTLIPLEWLISSIDKKLPEWKMCKPIISIGIDVARYGDNESVYVVLMGKKEIEKIHFKGKNIAENTGYAIEMIKKYEPDVIGIDDVGLGAGLVDNLQKHYPVVRFLGGSDADDKEKFFNLNSEAHWNVREDFRQGNISILNDNETIAQLNCRRYGYDEKKGRLQIESKKQMTKRGIESPDRADAFVIAHWASNHVNQRSNYDEEDRGNRNHNVETSRTGY